MRTRLSTTTWMTATWVPMAALMISCTAMLSGCEKPDQRLNAPPQGHADRQSDLQDNFVRMADNAMLKERSMSPVHFVSGTSELNALGARRLNRYVTLLKVYGGPLYYDGVADDEELAQKRVDQIHDYLVYAGLGSDLFTVNVGIAGGDGVPARSASDVCKAMTPWTKENDGISVGVTRVDIIKNSGTVSASN